MLVVTRRQLNPKPCCQELDSESHVFAMRFDYKIPFIRHPRLREIEFQQQP